MAGGLFDDTVRDLTERVTDPQLVRRLHSYQAGNMSRFDLMRDSGFSEAMQRWYEEVSDEHRRRGVDLAEVGVRVWDEWESRSIRRV